MARAVNVNVSPLAAGTGAVAVHVSTAGMRERQVQEILQAFMMGKPPPPPSAPAGNASEINLGGLVAGRGAYHQMIVKRKTHQMTEMESKGRVWTAGMGVRGAMSGEGGGKSARGSQMALLKAAALGWLNLAPPPNPPPNPPKEERKQNDHPKKSSESNRSSEPKKESAAALDDQRLIFASLVM